jgi:hypothetical protein
METMTLTLELPQDLERRLNDEASRLGLPLEKYALRLLDTLQEESHPSPPLDVARQEAERLEALAARGLLVQPRAQHRDRFKLRIPARGISAAAMVIEDRR